jgi:hypothetical protein
MFNRSKIDTLYGIVGFRQPDNPEYQILDANNLTSRSSRYVNDNPYCKVEIFKENQDYATISDAEFNEKLKELQEASISSVCDSVFNESDYIDRNLLYRFAQNKVNTETLPNGFIGYKISVSDKKSVAFCIKRVLLDFAGTGNVDILLFNSAKKDYVFKQTVNITSDHQEVQLDWVLNDTDSIYKGEYYIGYNTTGLTVQPYKRDYNNSNVKSCLTHLEIEDIIVNGHNSETLFDLTSPSGNSQATGLNFDITVYDDYTDLILNNEKLFAYAILLETQIRMISVNLASIRSNATQRQSQEMTIRMIQEIEGQEGDGVVRVVGLRPRLYSKIKSIRDEIKKLKEGYFGGRIMTDTLM